MLFSSIEDRDKAVVWLCISRKSMLKDWLTTCNEMRIPATIFMPSNDLSKKLVKSVSLKFGQSL